MEKKLKTGKVLVTLQDILALHLVYIALLICCAFNAHLNFAEKNFLCTTSHSAHTYKVYTLACGKVTFCFIMKLLFD